MAITVKNNTVLSKHLDGEGYFGACEILPGIAESILPVQFDPFWENAGRDESSIIDGGIKTIRQSIMIIEIDQKEYAIFGLRDQNKNRFRPVQAPEFVAFYNTFVDAGCSILTKAEYRGIVDTQAVEGMEEYA